MENLQESMRRLADIVEMNEGEYSHITHNDQDPTESKILVKGIGTFTYNQLEGRIKDRLTHVMEMIDSGNASQAASVLDANSGTYKTLIAMMKALAEVEAELAYGDNGGGTDFGIDTPGEE